MFQAAVLVTFLAALFASYRLRAQLMDARVAGSALHSSAMGVQKSCSIVFADRLSVSVSGYFDILLSRLLWP